MQREIVRDPLFLSQKSALATPDDLYLAQDLQDTLHAHQDACVGMAANMIGVQKRAIIFNYGLVPVVMFNPVLLAKNKPYDTEEGCLSLAGSRATRRYEEITVAYWDKDWQKKTISLSGFPAQICQHELDHLEGILI
ncbi:Peptide deformylase [Streptococcus sp. DD10]|uniref:peptide deformylase n=1 Tax=Streptococcus sp. DD10 TaxID=1777878 RepID=UPI00079ABCE7|nr:peptide deformylase [Streptococcus sp. DD10]KXT72549.1 Peptide deformylase [Streptococcus sp. DD10]